MAELTHISKQEAPEVRGPRGWGMEVHVAMASFPTRSTDYGTSSLIFRDFYVFALSGPRTIWFDSRSWLGLYDDMKFRWFIARSNSEGKPFAIYDFYDAKISHYAYHTLGAGMFGIGAAEHEPDDPENPYILDTELVAGDIDYYQPFYATAASGLSNFGDIQISIEQPAEKLAGEKWLEVDAITANAQEPT